MSIEERLGDLKIAVEEFEVKLNSRHERLTTIIDEGFGMQEVLPPDELLTRLEALLSKQRRDVYTETLKADRERRDLLRQVADLESEVRRLQGELRSKR